MRAEKTRILPPPLAAPLVARVGECTQTCGFRYASTVRLRLRDRSLAIMRDSRVTALRRADRRVSETILVSMSSKTTAKSW